MTQWLSLGQMQSFGWMEFNANLHNRTACIQLHEKEQNYIAVIENES